MSILSVDNISPIGSGTSVTVNKSVTLESGNTNITGVCTATSFVGGLPITNGADNRVITASSASAIQGESGFTFNGSLASIINSSGPTLELTTNTNAADASLRLHEGTTGSTTNGGGMFYSGADNKLHITCGTNLTTKRITITRDAGLIGINTDVPSSARLDIGADSGTYDHLRLRRISSDSNIASNWSFKPYGGHLYFREGGSTDKIQFDNNGDIRIMDGNLRVASGHGIDFSATADPSFGNTSNRQELLDDYEEGQWVPEYSGATAAGSVSYSYRKGYYIKIGAQVTVWIEMTVSSASGMSGSAQISNLPFNKNELGSNDATNTGTYYYSGTTNWYIQYHAQNKPIFTGWMPNNTNVIRIYNADHWGSVTLAPLNTNGRMSFSYTYTTSA